MKSMVCIVLNCILVVLFCGGVSSETILVPGDYPTIGTAIDAAANGDTVMVADGVYTGYGNRNVSFEGKAITVISENGPETCIIDCGGSSSSDHRAFNFISGETSESRLCGFTIRNGYAGPYMWPSHGGAILCEDSSPIIEYCIFENNHAYFSGGAIEANGGHVTIRFCSFTDNNVDFLGGAVYVHTAGTIENCWFDDNVALGTSGLSGSGGAIYASFDSVDINIDYCTFTRNSAESGGAIGASSGYTKITRCQFTDNTAHLGGAIRVGDEYMVIGGTETMGNTFIGNRAACGSELFIHHGTTIVDAQYNDFEGFADSEYWFYKAARFNFTGSTFALTPIEQDVYVAPDGDDTNDGLSWNSPFQTIHHAIGQINATPETIINVHLAPGTYSPSTTGELFPVPAQNWIILQGSGRDETILDVEQTDMGMMIYYKNLKIRDLTIQNGYHKVGGILCRGSSPVIENCNIFINFGYSVGGIDCYSDSAPVIRNCNITHNIGNEGGGIRFFNESNATVINCDISHNTGTNYGGGIRADYFSTPLIFGSRISNNGSFYGGGVCAYKSDIQLVNTLICNNFGGYGGGIFASQGSPVLSNCTVVDNFADLAGGYGGYVNPQAPITNCIFWNNSPDQIADDIEPDATYCNIQGGYPGEGNIDTDPMFITGLEGYFFLSQAASGQGQDSPSVDAGSDLAENLFVELVDETVYFSDLTTRTDGGLDSGQVDMGCHYPLGGVPSLCINDGDVNLDGMVTSGDGQLAFMIALAMYDPSPTQFCAADCNGDEMITSADGQRVFLKAMGLEECEDTVQMNNDE